MATNDQPSVVDGQLSLPLTGRLDAEAVARLWPDVRRRLEARGVESVIVEASRVTYCDGAGMALLEYLRRASARLDISLSIEGLSADYTAMLKLYALDTPPDPMPQARSVQGFVEEVGKTFCTMLCGLRDHIAFLGELAVAAFRTLLRPSGLRMGDFLGVAETAGAQALPITGMLGFLVGLIIAFQGAVLMKQFGAEIYIADSVGMLVLRELGPLMTAIIVAGRTGSAFAAELGTMKVNEEIDAFTTMGLDPVRFLVIPRVLAATLMTPLLAVFANLAGLIGGAVVMKGIGFPLVTYANRVAAAVTVTDLISGLVKALVFGLLISASGCLCGLRTGEGASAVGHSATRAVVSSIVMIVVADGIFAVVFYFLGI